MSSTEELLPLPLRPELHRRVWGGHRLRELVQSKEDEAVGPAGEPVGEAWLAGPASLVAGGPFSGASVAELVARFGAALIGTVPLKRHGAHTPLLLKLLDVCADLSVQVHPADPPRGELARGSGVMGKSEAWLVLAAEAGARVLWGFKGAVSPQGVREAATAGELVSFMNEVPVAAGDVVVLPAGTVHAAGKGMLLFEVQQASDVTYRLYDHGRVGADGRPRELHLSEALPLSDLSGARPQKLTAAELEAKAGELVQRPEFALERFQLNPGEAYVGAVGGFSLEFLTLTSGSARLKRITAGSEGHAVSLRPFQTVLLPASLVSDYALVAEGDSPAEVLVSYVPAPREGAAAGSLA